MMLIAPPIGVTGPKNAKALLAKKWRPSTNPYMEKLNKNIPMSMAHKMPFIGKAKRWLLKDKNKTPMDKNPW